MLFTEYDQDKVNEMFKEEGRVEGREEGNDEAENRMDRLSRKMREAGHTSDEIAHAASDKVYRQKLYAQFGI